MANKLFLSVVTPERLLFEGEVRYLSIPGGSGFMGVLVDHAPLISSLKPGPVEIKPLEGKPITFSITRPGFFDIFANRASILLDAADSNALA
jgi:F-type H+-transporting ATPase subunit epsilon